MGTGGLAEHMMLGRRAAIKFLLNGVPLDRLLDRLMLAGALRMRRPPARSASRTREASSIAISSLKTSSWRWIHRRGRARNLPDAKRGVAHALKGQLAWRSAND